MWPDWFRTAVKRSTSRRFREAVRRAPWAALAAVIRTVFYVFGLPALYLLELIAPVRIYELRIDHIGHLAIEPELLMRRLRLDGAGRATRVFVARGAPANRQLFEMWKRRLRIVETHSHRVSRMFSIAKPLLMRTGFGQPMPGAFTGWAGGERTHELMAGAGPTLAFTPEEEARGQAELRRIGVPEGAWFVPFHCRDPLYYAMLSGYTHQYERVYRDHSIDTMFDAMRWIAARGGYAIRMGAVVEKALPDLGPRVIDYATHHRTDFMDIYLSAKARFFMGSLSGLVNVPQIFDVPFGIHNSFPCMYVTSGKIVLYVRMFLRDRKTGEILSFPEMKRRGLLQCPPERAPEFETQQYWDDLGLDIVHNDAEDITNLCMDLMDQVEGRAPHPEAVRLEAIHRMLYDGVDRSPLAGRISPRFAMRHADLIEPLAGARAELASSALSLGRVSRGT